MKRVIVMCVDALFTSDLEDARKYPGFRELLDEAAVYTDVYSIYPTLTYPCHTTVVTGCWPDKHGITHNEKLDPSNENREWNWYYDDIRVKTIFNYAKEQGLKTAALQWPVTGGAPVDYLLPEIWSLDPKEDLADVMLRYGSESMRDICQKNRHIMDGKENPAWDSFYTQCAVDVIHTYKPDVMFLHPSHLDHTRHVHGVHAPQVQDALRLHGLWIKKIRDALREENILDETAMIILGDHSHLQVDSCVNPNTLLTQSGLIQTAGDGVVTDWDAYIHSCGISAQVYAKNEDAEKKVLDILNALKTVGYIRDIFSADQLKRDYHVSGDFKYMIEASPNYGFGGAIQGNLITSVDSSDYKYSVATHGHLPSRGDKPCFVIHGRVKPGRYAGARLIDEAPTILKLLDIPYDPDSMDGKALF